MCMKNCNLFHVLVVHQQTIRDIFILQLGNLPSGTYSFSRTFSALSEMHEYLGIIDVCCRVVMIMTVIYV